MTRKRITTLIAAVALVTVLALGFIIAPHFGFSSADGAVLAIGLQKPDGLLANHFVS